MAETTLEKVTFEQVARDAERLTPDEQRRLHTLLEDLTSPVASEKQDIEARERLFTQRLLEKGLITHIPARESMSDELRRQPPAIVQGESLSETVMQARR